MNSAKKFDFKVLRKFHPLTLYGIDEVGRGSLAGPVVACACGIWGDIKRALEKLDTIGITDSKQLSANQRKEKLSSLGISVTKLLQTEHWSGHLCGNSELAVSIAQSSADRVDQVNVLRASLEAMVSAYQGLNLKRSGPFYLMVDGARLPPEWQSLENHEGVIKGDQQSLIIALASIIAKQYRDALMKKFDQKWPGYSLAKNVGYPTKEHRECLKKLGPSPCHRKTFRGVRDL